MRKRPFDPDQIPRSCLEALRGYWWICRRLGVPIPAPAAPDGWWEVRDQLQVSTPRELTDDPQLATLLYDTLTRGFEFALDVQYAGDWLACGGMSSPGDPWGFAPSLESMAIARVRAQR